MNLSKYSISTNLPLAVTRELKEGEAFCPKCRGLGFYMDGGYLTWCRECYQGILPPCMYCGEPLSISDAPKHYCDQRKEAEARAAWDKWRNAKNTLYLGDLPPRCLAL